jgi:hypothetical protein
MIVLLGVLFLLLAAALAWLHAEKGWFRPTPHQWIVGHTEHLLAYASVLLIVGIPAALIAALATSLQRPDRELPPPSPPELEVAIVGTESPRMTITNLGMRTATDVTYTVEAVKQDPRAAHRRRSRHPGSELDARRRAPDRESLGAPSPNHWKTDDGAAAPSCAAW